MPTFTPLSGSTPDETVNPDNSITVGVEFTVSTTCSLTAIRWYKPATGTNFPDDRTAGLWTTTDGAAGTQVVATFSGTTVGSGWQTYPLPAPYTLSPGVRYRAGVFHPQGGYAANSSFWTSGPGASGITAGPVTLLSAAAAYGGKQSSFNYGPAIVMPDGGGGANYWVDVQVDGDATPTPSTWTWNYTAKMG